MRRALSATILLLATAACSASAERPEGIVERWIVSMNQGVAGEPLRWADDYATAQVSPTWDTDEPGAIDSFSVGAARPEGEAFVVPFGLERLDGSVTSGDAVVGRSSLPDGTTELVVSEVRLGSPSGDTGRWREEAPPASWPIAIGVGALLTASSVVAVRLVRERPS